LDFFDLAAAPEVFLPADIDLAAGGLAAGNALAGGGAVGGTAGAVVWVAGAVICVAGVDGPASSSKGGDSSAVSS
jgi:hypothetical protein